MTTELLPSLHKIRVLLRDKENQFFQLLWITFDGADLYAGVPGTGFKLSHHNSGEVHIRKNEPVTGEPPPIVLVTEWGAVVEKGLIRRTLQKLHEAEKVFSVVYFLKSPSTDGLRPYKRTTRNKSVFVLDGIWTNLNPRAVRLGVWAVPSGRSFRYTYHPPVDRRDTFKFEESEPQIWCEVGSP